MQAGAAGKRFSDSKQGAAAIGMVLLLALFQLATARLGIDYGSHWDEHFLQGILADSVKELDAWPRRYFYGSLYAGTGYLALAPEWIGALPRLVGAAREVGQYQGRLEPTQEIREIQGALLERIYDPAFLIRTRTLFALAATLGIVALFLAGRRLGRSPWSGVLAAAVLALSWEFNTHARHIAVDGILVALVATFLALLARFLGAAPVERNPDRWLYLAAAVCGLATGAKFHGLLLLVPLVGVVLARGDRAHPGRAAKQIAACLGVAGAVMVAVNPGLVFDTVQVANDWGYTARDYWRESDPLGDPYKSLGTLHHLREATVYVITAVLSPRPALSVALFGVAALGFVASWDRDWKTTLAVGAFVPVYLLVMSRAGLIIVRNYLPVLPVLAIFVMWGLEALLLGGRRRRWLAFGLCGLWAVSNGTHIVSTALTVHRPHDAERLVREVREYIGQRPDERFVVSRGIASVARRAGAPLRDLPNVRGIASSGGPFDYLVYLPSEYSGQLPGVSRVGYFRAVFGSREVNYDYYPNWVGHGLDRRVYLLDERKARDLLAALLAR